MRLAGSALEHDRHVCAFFDSPADELRIVLPFVRAGLVRGQRAVYIVPRDRREEMGALIAEQTDLTDSSRRGQLLVLTSEDMYLPEGRFDEDRMIGGMERLLNAGRPLGFDLTRLVAHPELVPADSNNARAFIMYESRLNLMLKRYADPVICAYDLSETPTRVILDVLRTHPMAIIGGVLYENPFYMQPADFIAEVMARDWPLEKLNGAERRRRWPVPPRSQARDGDAQPRAPGESRPGDAVAS